MKRTTISLPDDLAAALDREARRCGTSVSHIAREAIEVRLRRDAAAKERRRAFISLFRSGHGSLSTDHEEILREEFKVDRDR
jgi:predicted transcriptional regulator